LYFVFRQLQGQDNLVGSYCIGDVKLVHLKVGIFRACAMTIAGLDQVIKPIAPRDDYVPAITCCSSAQITHRQLTKLLESMPNDESGIRREYRGRHLFLHPGDWMQWLARRDKQDKAALERAEKAVAETMASGRGRMRNKRDLGGR
jgi:hypothetical protein